MRQVAALVGECRRALQSDAMIQVFGCCPESPFRALLAAPHLMNHVLPIKYCTSRAA